MAAAALEIHDAGLLLVEDAGQASPRTPPSPGYALIDGSRLLTGIEAVLSSRLHPRRVQHRFWRELDTARLKHPLFRDRSSADLAHAHLNEVWRSARPGIDAVWIAAPGSMTDRQLGLLISIARACRIPLAGMVDAAVAACTEPTGAARLVHLDLELHRAVLTEIEVGDDLVRRRVEIDDTVGLIPLQDRWMKCIAETFVRRTRFDPFHSAAAEQALHRRLQQWLSQLEHANANATVMELEARQRKHSIEIEREELIDFVAEPYSVLSRLTERMTDGPPATLLLSDRVAALPGIAERLGGTALPVGAAAAGALQYRDQLGFDGEDLLFITRLTRHEHRNAPA